MTQELHITFGTDDGRVIEADVEVRATRKGRRHTDPHAGGYWDFEAFLFEEVTVTQDGNTELLDFMSEELVEQAEEEAEREFLKLDL